MDKPETISFKRRKLPHWMVSGRPYFVTFRLKDTLPRRVVEELKKRKDEIERARPDSMIEYQRYEFRKIESILDVADESNSKYYLTRPEIAGAIMDSFDFIENKYSWRFPAYVVMPNHVHCLAVYNDKGIQKNLIGTIGCLKSFVGRESNKLLGLSGRVWADENFDHWCRTPDKVEGVIRYIANNPVKARLVKNARDWPWTKLPEYVAPSESDGRTN